MENKITNTTNDNISRKEAIKKISNYGKYAAITAIGTYLMLNPKKSQAQSKAGTGFGGSANPGSANPDSPNF